MPMSAVSLAARAKAKMLADQDSAVTDCPALDALCKAFAEAFVEEVTENAEVTFPASSINVAGSSTNQSNPAPVTGGTVA
jgi:hypothetical protein